MAAVYYLAKDETLVATTATHRLRKITLNIESRKPLKHAERIDKKRFDLNTNSKYVYMVAFICSF